MIDTIASVVQSVPPVAPTTVGAAVFDIFKVAPDLIAIAIVDRQRPVGLINRHDLSAVLATPYGRALYAGKPIELLMDRKPLIVGIDLHIDRLEEIILSERPEALATGFILVRDDGTYAGIGSALSVLRSSVERTIRRNCELEQLRAEAEAANRAKSQFIAHMSHEIRTPMNAVIGLSRLALKHQLSSQLRDYLSKIFGSASMLLGIINDILDFSRIEAGKLTLERADFNLDVVIDGVASTTALRASEKDIELVVSIAPDVPTALVGDPLRLGQVLMNLINNAVKFTEQGEVVLTVKVRIRQTEAVELDFSVRDTGIGISDTERARLFQSFSQGDSSMSRRYGGSGLGLAISRAITDLMCGTIEVASQPGVGSTFSFSAQFGLQAAQQTRTVPTPRLQGLRVLVVDDNPTAREMLRELLVTWGVETQFAGSGPGALEALGQAAARGVPFDLVLLDWRMPEPDGVETAHLIRERRDIGRVPPIILMTGYGQEQAVRQARRYGVKGFVAKPINKSTLLETMQAALGHQRPKRQVRHPDELPADAARLAGARILLVEDNDINCQIAIENLAAAGLLVDIARNGRIAVEMVRARPDRFDAVLMDLQMPEMDGLEATRLIRLEFGSDRLPIIAMTAHAFEEERQQCIAAGMDDHVAKPVDPVTLIRTLARWIKPGAHETGDLVTPPQHQPPPTGLRRDLRCFDVEAALLRVNGNERLLCELFAQFCREFGDAVQKMRAQVKAGHLGEAERLAHTLAGVSGALGAKAVFQATRAVEHALRDRRLGAQDLRLDALATALLEAREEAASAGTAPAEIAAHRADADPASAPSAIAELRTLLAENNLAAGNHAERLAMALAGAGLDPHIAQLTEQVERLDYREAERTLDALSAQIGSVGERENV